MYESTIKSYCKKTSNQLKKEIILLLANAPKIVLKNYLEELKNQEEKKQAENIINKILK